MTADLLELSYMARGASSTVYHGLWQHVWDTHRQQTEVACKFMISPYTPTGVNEALLELSHPNLVRCYAGVWCDGTGV